MAGCTGADIDEELVNNVFRAAHSIKGGAGFMGLSAIKELSHKIENLLGFIRNREVVPEPGVISILLKAFDTLRDMINNVTNSNQMDISQHVRALVDIAAESVPDFSDACVDVTIQIVLPDGRNVLAASSYELDQAKKEGKNCYRISGQ